MAVEKKWSLAYLHTLKSLKVESPDIINHKMELISAEWKPEIIVETAG